ncbi:TlpA family protein disulfide reductase [Streptacidiphilus melanogenes]|uniref:TlpA family protein disulfide reductase n=1 Tax=Streptacidiphilus melanogenes TaxID=411235 RepID=UPI0005AAE09F|nr:thioredoxin family protein [Streptacidiphilus melanogenes]
MSDPTGLIVAVVVLAAATVFGLVRARRDGRLRAGRGDAGLRLSSGELGESLGDRATLVQFSTSFCATCPGTRRLLLDVASGTPGVRHVEIDAEQRLDLVRHAEVMRTPTVLVLDRDGRVVRRASGPPTRDEVVSALELATAS